jgi:hypothetical protein
MTQKVGALPVRGKGCQALHAMPNACRSTLEAFQWKATPLLPNVLFSFRIAIQCVADSVGL